MIIRSPSSYFSFYNAPNVFSDNRSELQAGQFSTLLIQSHALAETSKAFPEKDVVWMAAYEIGRAHV